MEILVPLHENPNKAKLLKIITPHILLLIDSLKLYKTQLILDYKTLAITYLVQQSAKYISFLYMKIINVINWETLKTFLLMLVRKTKILSEVGNTLVLQKCLLIRNCGYIRLQGKEEQNLKTELMLILAYKDYFDLVMWTQVSFKVEY